MNDRNSFLNANGLQINDGKTTLTEFMLHQKRAKSKGIPPELTVSVLEKGVLIDKHISDSPQCRTLGINLRNDLSWENHLQTGKKAILPSIRRQLGGLMSLKHTISMKGKLHLVNALLISSITYLICIWGNTTSNILRKVQVVQNMAGRFVTGKNRFTRQSDLMIDCRWLNVEELAKYHSLVQLWKTLRWGKPEYLESKLQEEEEEYISTDIPRLKLTAGSFRCKTVRNWNSMNVNLRCEQSLGRFKLELKKWIHETRVDGRGDGRFQTGNGG